MTTAPNALWCWPFACILFAIALFPMLPKVAHWWEGNRNKLLLSLFLAASSCAYYALRGYGFAGSAPGWHAVDTLLHHAILADYVPFMSLLFSLYVMSGGIRLSGDIPARPLTNSTFLLSGALLASLVGTTGASMLLIRPLLQINRQRRQVKHTVIFFIFLVSNIGGALLPIGDPPLFLGYLRGVPFFWTLNLFWPWALTTALVLTIYFIVETIAYRRENPADILQDETQWTPITLTGKGNLFLLAAAVMAVALLVPGQSIPLIGGVVPALYLREITLLALAALSWAATPPRIHAENQFNFHAITEVAVLFVGIFVTMQLPIELLRIHGSALGINSPMQFFWMTGILSSVLDNAPTYVVFFELAGTPRPVSSELLYNLNTVTGHIPVRDLLAISCGAVFMGANTYIGNGPNFLVKNIAEHHGIKMPGFLGYTAYSTLILIPIFTLISLFFF